MVSRFPNIRVFQAIDSGFTLGTTFLPFRGVLFLALTCLSWLILRQTVFGQHIYALGGNAEAARLSGVKTVRLRVETFILSGLAAGVATILFLSWLRVAKPDTATGYELDSIAACVVGGVSLQGGRGSILGAAAGCLLLQALRTQITMSGFPEEYRTLVTGIVILIFAAAALALRMNELETIDVERRALAASDGILFPSARCSPPWFPDLDPAGDPSPQSTCLAVNSMFFIVCRLVVRWPFRFQREGTSRSA